MIDTALHVIAPSDPMVRKVAAVESFVHVVDGSTDGEHHGYSR